METPTIHLSNPASTKTLDFQIPVDNHCVPKDVTQLGCISYDVTHADRLPDDVTILSRLPDDVTISSIKLPEDVTHESAGRPTSSMSHFSELDSGFDEQRATSVTPSSLVPNLLEESAAVAPDDVPSGHEKDNEAKDAITKESEPRHEDSVMSDGEPNHHAHGAVSHLELLSSPASSRLSAYTHSDDESDPELDCSRFGNICDASAIHAIIDGDTSQPFEHYMHDITADKIADDDDDENDYGKESAVITLENLDVATGRLSKCDVIDEISDRHVTSFHASEAGYLNVGHVVSTDDAFNHNLVGDLDANVEIDSKEHSKKRDLNTYSVNYINMLNTFDEVNQGVQFQADANYRALCDLASNLESRGGCDPNRSKMNETEAPRDFAKFDIDYTRWSKIAPATVEHENVLWQPWGLDYKNVQQHTHSLHSQQHPVPRTLCILDSENSDLGQLSRSPRYHSLHKNQRKMLMAFEDGPEIETESGPVGSPRLCEALLQCEIDPRRIQSQFEDQKTFKTNCYQGEYFGEQENLNCFPIDLGSFRKRRRVRRGPLMGIGDLQRLRHDLYSSNKSASMQDQLKHSTASSILPLPIEKTAKKDLGLCSGSSLDPSKYQIVSCQPSASSVTRILPSFSDVFQIEAENSNKIKLNLERSFTQKCNLIVNDPFCFTAHRSTLSIAGFSQALPFNPNPIVAKASQISVPFKPNSIDWNCNLGSIGLQGKSDDTSECYYSSVTESNPHAEVRPESDLDGISSLQWDDSVGKHFPRFLSKNRRSWPISFDRHPTPRTEPSTRNASSSKDEVKACEETWASSSNEMQALHFNDPYSISREVNESIFFSTSLNVSVPTTNFPPSASGHPACFSNSRPVPVMQERLNRMTLNMHNLSEIEQDRTHSPVDLRIYQYQPPAETSSNPVSRPNELVEDVIAVPPLMGSRAPLNSLAVALMTEWFEKNLHHPYPSLEEKQRLANEGGISLAQCTSWFGNRRWRQKRKTFSPPERGVVENESGGEVKAEAMGKRFKFDSGCRRPM